MEPTRNVKPVQKKLQTQAPRFRNQRVLDEADFAREQLERRGRVEDRNRELKGE